MWRYFQKWDNINRSVKKESVTNSAEIWTKLRRLETESIQSDTHRKLVLVDFDRRISRLERRNKDVYWAEPGMWGVPSFPERNDRVLATSLKEASPDTPRIRTLSEVVVGNADARG
jgi:hypothetical protein